MDDDFDVGAPWSRWSAAKPVKFAGVGRDVFLYPRGVITDRKSRSSSPYEIRQEDALGFVLEVQDVFSLMTCQFVTGFREAVAAASDPRLAMPRRLVLARPGTVTLDWLAGWSEDDVQVRRTLTIRRRGDGAVIVAVATIAAFGSGTQTMLALESATVPGRIRRVVRSGVHSTSFLDAIRTAHKQFLPCASANDVRPFATEPSDLVMD